MRACGSCVSLVRAGAWQSFVQAIRSFSNPRLYSSQPSARKHYTVHFKHEGSRLLTKGLASIFSGYCTFSIVIPVHEDLVSGKCRILIWPGDLMDFIGSREQNYRPEDCATCHSVLIGRKGHGFWEGGKGTSFVAPFLACGALFVTCARCNDCDTTHGILVYLVSPSLLTKSV